MIRGLVIAGNRHEYWDWIKRNHPESIDKTIGMGAGQVKDYPYVARERDLYGINSLKPDLLDNVTSKLLNEETFKIYLVGKYWENPVCKTDVGRDILKTLSKEFETVDVSEKLLEEIWMKKKLIESEK